MNMHIHPLYVAISACDIVALCLALGALSCRAWVAPAGPSYLDRPLWWLTGTGILALATSSAALLIGRTMEMSGSPFTQSLTLLPAVLQHTRFGQIWLVRPAVLLALALFWWRGSHKHTPANAIVMLVLVAVIAFTRSATGHPADMGQFTPAEWVDWIHLLAIGVWVGSLLSMVLVAFPAIFAARPGMDSTLAIAERLSRLAGRALLAILVTGVVSARHYVVTLHNLTDTAYGRVLLVKLAFVAGAIALGALNRYGILPQLRRAATAAATAAPVAPVRLLARAIRLEVLVLLGAVITAAVLLHAMPPSDMPQPAAGAHTSAAMTTHVVPAPRPVRTPTIPV